MIDQILECLERKRTRAMYSALGEVIGSFRTRTPSGRSSQFPCAKAPRARRRGSIQRGYCLPRQTMLTMVFKLCRSAEKRWCRLQG